MKKVTSKSSVNNNGSSQVKKTADKTAVVKPGAKKSPKKASVK